MIWLVEVVVVEMEEREDSYQCLWVGKMEGLASCWTWTMKVCFSGSEEEDDGRERVAMKNEKVREKRREGDGAIEGGG